MRFKLKFSEQDHSFRLQFREAVTVSDGGYERGFTEGKAEGITEGEAIGYDNGHSAGYTEGETAGYNTGHAAGYSEGDTAGYNRGHAEGYVEGSAAGYNTGYDKGVQDTTPVGEVEITENGTHDVAAFASAKVAVVSKSKLPSVIDRTVTEITAEDLAGSTKIGPYAFYMCENLESVIIPQQINRIEEYAFHKCYALNSIVFETKELERIGTNAFYYCSALKTVKLPKTKYMDAGVFYYCKALESADLSEVTSPTYGNQTFMYDTALKTVLLGQASSIPSQMFYECPALENIVIPDTVTSIGASAFYKCSMLEFVDLTGLYRVLPTLSNVNAFTNTGVSTPNSTFEIRVSKGRKNGLSAMTNWAAYADKIVEVGNEEIPEWESTVGLSYSKQSNYCISTGVGTATATDIVIAQFVDEMPVTRVNAYVFNSKNLTSIVIPRTVTYLGSYAFSRNPRCTSVQVLGPLSTIEESVFYQLTDLSSVELAEGIELISYNMFSWCENLPSIAIPSTVAKIGDYAFQYCKKLEFLDLTAYGDDIPFPTLEGTKTFSNCGVSTAAGKFEIRVPAGRASELADMTNWGALDCDIVEV